MSSKRVAAPSRLSIISKTVDAPGPRTQLRIVTVRTRVDNELLDIRRLSESVLGGEEII
tara:strand:- start:233 stop:409 length:177 start_codon:yes stop_codon:yes gene_type:complete